MKPSLFLASFITSLAVVMSYFMLFLLPAIVVIWLVVRQIHRSSEPLPHHCDGGEGQTPTAAWQAQDDALWNEAIRKAGTL